MRLGCNVTTSWVFEGDFDKLSPKRTSPNHESEHGISVHCGCSQWVHLLIAQSLAGDKGCAACSFPLLPYFEVDGNFWLFFQHPQESSIVGWVENSSLPHVWHSTQACTTCLCHPPASWATMLTPCPILLLPRMSWHLWSFVHKNHLWTWHSPVTCFQLIEHVKRDGMSFVWLKLCKIATSVLLRHFLPWWF